MTVAQLIEILSALPPDLPIYVSSMGCTDGGTGYSEENAIDPTSINHRPAQPKETWSNGGPYPARHALTIPA